MLAAVGTATDPVRMAKLAVVAPSGTVTLAGTAAAIWLLDSVTVRPPGGAIPLRVTVPVEGVPPRTLLGLTVSDVRAGGLIVNVAVRGPLKLPVIVTFVTATTPLVVTGKVVAVVPAATVTLAGVVEDELSSDNVTTAPPTGAALLKVTVPVEETPPSTLAGFMDTETRTGGVIPNAAVWVVPP
jgi:hypothetical protein